MKKGALMPHKRSYSREFIIHNMKYSSIKNVIRIINQQPLNTSLTTSKKNDIKIIFFFIKWRQEFPSF
jgi:hypothetical protein